MVRIPRFHRGGRGSIPRLGSICAAFTDNAFELNLPSTHYNSPYIEYISENIEGSDFLSVLHTKARLYN